MGIYVVVIRDGDYSEFYRLHGATTIEEGKEVYFKILRKEIEEYGSDSYAINYIDQRMRQEDVATFLKVEEVEGVHVNDFLANLKGEMAQKIKKQKEDKEREEFERLKKKYG